MNAFRKRHPITIILIYGGIIISLMLAIILLSGCQLNSVKADDTSIPRADSAGRQEYAVARIYMSTNGMLICREPSFPTEEMQCLFVQPTAARLCTDMGKGKPLSCVSPDKLDTSRL